MARAYLTTAIADAVKKLETELSNTSSLVKSAKLNEQATAYFMAQIDEYTVAIKQLKEHHKTI